MVPGRADTAARASAALVPPLGLAARLLGIAVAALGVQCLTNGMPVPGLEPLPAWLSASSIPGYLTGLLLVVVATAVIVRPRTRWASLALGTFVTYWFVFLQLPQLATHLGNGSLWTAAFETAALGGSVWVLAALSAWPPPSAVAGERAQALEDAQAVRTRRALRWMATGGGVAFGVALCVFCALHLIYHGIVASLVPAWIPGKLFWAIATGLVFLAGGASILTRRLAPLGATLVGTMFGLWVLIVHAPRVAAAPGTRAEWTSLFVALAMCGGAWIVAYAMQPRVRRQM